MREPVGGTITVDILDSVPDRAPFEPKVPQEVASGPTPSSSARRN